MSKPCVIDTMVLRKANAALTKQPQQHRDFAKRLALLSRIQQAELQVLYSQKLLHEYRQQIEEPRNDFVKSFFELLLDPAKSKLNYHKPWSGKERQARRLVRAIDDLFRRRADAEHRCLPLSPLWRPRPKSSQGTVACRHLPACAGSWFGSSPGTFPLVPDHDLDHPWRLLACGGP